MAKRSNTINKTTVELNNGDKFIIVHNFSTLEGNINSFDAAFDSWIARTDDFSAKSFVDYVKSKKEHGRIFMTHEDFLRFYKEEATEEQWQAENN